VQLTVVAGPDPELYWSEHTGLADILQHPDIRVLGFISDVRPLYNEANVVVVPTLVSAGTNLKVLEAIAMQRAVVSTSSGCAGLGLKHGETVWIADQPEEFAAAIEALLGDRELRQAMASKARIHAGRFDWKQIGWLQRNLLYKAIPQPVQIRAATPEDVDAIVAIQSASPESSQWHREDYLVFDCVVAECSGEIAAFLVSRQIVPGEREILNVAVHPSYRRLGIASELIQSELKAFPGEHFLEVRESNVAARRVYKRLGFREVGVRPAYYEDPPESGIVMRFFS
jgi:ribosomal protein S18 acetylase RimI-like enzyme